MASLWDIMVDPVHAQTIAGPRWTYSPDEGYEHLAEGDYETEIFECLSSTADFPSIKHGLYPKRSGVSRSQTAPLKQSLADLGSLGQSTPGTAEVLIQQRQRDARLVAELKRIHDFKCQICGHRIRDPHSESGWCIEAHHIQPIGRPHFGPDTADNILIVCPNHHTELDKGVLDLRLSEIRVTVGHRIEQEFIDYYEAEIFAALPVTKLDSKA